MLKIDKDLEEKKKPGRGPGQEALAPLQTGAATWRMPEKVKRSKQQCVAMREEAKDTPYLEPKSCWTTNVGKAAEAKEPFIPLLMEVENKIPGWLGQPCWVEVPNHHNTFVGAIEEDVQGNGDSCNCSMGTIATVTRLGGMKPLVTLSTPSPPFLEPVRPVRMATIGSCTVT